MKTTAIAGMLVVVALWFGYALGYQRGLKTERRAWESTEQVTPMAAERDRRDRLDHRIFYTNPHFGPVRSAARGLPAVNRPDPRVYERFGRSSS